MPMKEAITGQAEVNKNCFGASLAVQWLKFHTSNAGGLGLIPRSGNLRSHMPQDADKKFEK